MTEIVKVLVPLLSGEPGLRAMGSSDVSLTEALLEAGADCLSLVHEARTVSDLAKVCLAARL